jgi:hypothetical protein
MAPILIPTRSFVPERNDIQISTVTNVLQRQGQICAFVQLWLNSDHDYRNVLHARRPLKGR